MSQGNQGRACSVSDSSSKFAYCCPGLRWVAPDKAYCPATAKCFRYPPELKSLLEGWRNFRTLEDVVLDYRGFPTITRLQQVVPSGNSFWSTRVVPTIAKAAFPIAHRLQEALLSSDPGLAHTKKLLTDLADIGVLISDDQLVRRCLNTSYEGVKGVKISSVGLIDDRTPSTAFDIQLQTYLDHFRERCHKLNVIVTALKDFRDLERRSLLDLRRRYDCDISYLDERSRHDIAKNLVRHGVPPDRAKFALFGLGSKDCGLGTLRNALLLKYPSVGLLICDLATVCRPSWHPYAGDRPKLKVTSQEVESYKLLQADDSLLQVSQKMDLIAAHEQGLGKPLPQLVADFHARGHVSFESTCEHLLHSLWQGRGYVVATINGILSVLDHISPELAISLLERETDHVFYEQFATRNSLQGKLMLNSVDCYTLAHKSPVGEHSLCLDTSANLPPFLPVGRDDREIFFSTLFCSFPNSYALSVPCSLPAKGRPQAQSLSDWEPSFRLRDLIIPCITSAKLSGENDYIIKAIGEGLQMLARLPSAEFRQQVRLAVKERFDSDALGWKLPSKSRKRHSSLSKIIDTFTDRRNEMIKGPQLFNVSDIAIGTCTEDKSTAVQETFMRFGDLLQSWTDILEISALEP